jgi:hypothetical protein
MLVAITSPLKFCHRVEAVVGGALGGRPLDHLNGGQKARIKAGEGGSVISHRAHL